MLERTSSWPRTLAVLLAMVLAACGSAASPVVPAGSTTPSPAAGATASPAGTELPETPLEAITYSEDPASALMAVAELGPNEADVERLELYRDAAGGLRSVVAFHAVGGPSVLTFDSEGLPSALESNGYRVDFAYTATEVQTTVTDPQGAVVTKRGPLEGVLEGAAPAMAPARMAMARTALAEPRLAPYPMTVESWGVVPIEVRYSGKSRDPYSRHLTFESEVCVPGEGLNCDVRLMTMWHEGKSTLVALVNTWIHAPDDPTAPGVIWRTRADCESFTPWWQSALSKAGWIQTAVAIVAGAATLAGYTNPALGLTIVLAAGAIKVLSRGTETLVATDCGSVPNLLDVRKAALDQKAGATATVRVKAIDDCAPGRTNAWRVKKSKIPEISIQPLLPVNQSRFDQPGTGLELAYLPQMATLTVDAADCGKEMTGKVDLKTLYPTAAALAAINKLVTENRVALTLTEVDGNPDVKATVTGELTLTIRLDGPALWRLHSGVGEAVFGVDAKPMPPEWADCAITATTTGALEGKQSTGGGQGLKGLATITAASTISGCEDTDANLGANPKPVTVEKVPWTAAGDDAAMRGIVHLAGTTEESTYDLPFVVRAKATTP